MNRRPKPRKRRPRSDGERLTSTIGLVAAGLLFIGTMGYAFSVGQVPSENRPFPDERSSSKPAPVGLLSSVPAQPASSTISQDGRQVAINTYSEEGERFECVAGTVTDGDTIRCGDLRVRLAGIDAPELPGHCRAGRQCVDGDPFASAANLENLISSKPLACVAIETDAYGRTVAFCASGQIDLSCAQLHSGNAVERYGSIECEGTRRL